ncbi:Cg6 protein, putative [Plasmodium relictum]|uniref:Cg6 protein, putative n=1 Tax=Plasmodium relictum TaxID=85471 RepID=A0A1J1H0C5_PLARL|nr:Cg6 protein, putative [Plasmodium relictum]CRG98423.1 Cg6 protein, putative [Plasmodium relictum]
MNRYKKVSNIIYIYSVFNICSNCIDHIPEKHIFELKKYAKLQIIFCENRNDKSNITYETSSNKILKSFVNEEKEINSTSKEAQKKKFNDNLKYKNILNNENSIIDEEGENEKYNCNTINKSTECFNETDLNEKNEEKTKNNKKNYDQMNNSEMYNEERNNDEEGKNVKNMDESQDELDEDMINLIQDILKKYNIVLFMKGTALNPFCKYSKQAIHILKLNKVKEIHTVNILDNEKLRNALKIYSEWPTFPQLYVNSKFIGGIDKLQELHDNNKLKELIENF